VGGDTRRVGTELGANTGTGRMETVTRTATMGGRIRSRRGSRRGKEDSKEEEEGKTHSHVPVVSSP